MRVWIVVLVTGVAAALHADDSTSVGTRVRVGGVARGLDSALDGRLTGEVVATDGATLTVRRDQGGLFALRWSEIDGLEVSRGRRSRGASGLRGAGRGALVGASLSLALLVAAGRSSDVGYDAALTFIAAPAVCATVGFVIGAASPSERWARVDAGRPRVRIGPTTGPRGRGAGLAVSVGF